MESTRNLLELCDVTCAREENHPIFSNVSFTMNERDIVILQGKSGSGKTTLLKCLAHLNLYGGQIKYRGRSPQSYGIPTYRTHVMYVPQRPSLLPGTPRDFLTKIFSFSSRKSIPKDVNGPLNVAEAVGIDSELWDRNWSDLSGGESQRMSLAIAVGLNTAGILLLDEPTSALDPESTFMVEKLLTRELQSAESTLKALVWITHSEEQARRIGTRFLRVSAGGCTEYTPHSEV